MITSGTITLLEKYENIFVHHMQTIYFLNDSIFVCFLEITEIKSMCGYMNLSIKKVIKSEPFGLISSWGLIQPIEVKTSIPK